MSNDYINICKNCNKIFSSKQVLQYHISHKVCMKIKKDFYCSFCNKYYKTKYTLLKHLNMKHPKNKNELIKKKSEILRCNDCGKTFSRIDNLKRHREKYCKKESNKTVINNINITNNITNITNNTINNTINNTTNITINNFGSENINDINDTEILKCISRCYSCIPKLFKLIHIDIPENRNLYLSNMKDSFLYLYKDNKWELYDLNKILTYIREGKKDLMEKYYIKNIDKFNDYKQKNINKMIKDYNQGLLNKQYDKELKMLLVDHKEILKHSFKKELV